MAFACQRNLLYKKILVGRWKSTDTRISIQALAWLDAFGYGWMDEQPVIFDSTHWKPPSCLSAAAATPPGRRWPTVLPVRVPVLKM